MSVSFQRLLTPPVLVVPHSNCFVVRAANDDFASSRVEQQPPHPVIMAQLGSQQQSTVTYVYTRMIVVLNAISTYQCEEAYTCEGVPESNGLVSRAGDEERPRSWSTFLPLGTHTYMIRNE